MVDAILNEKKHEELKQSDLLEKDVTSLQGIRISSDFSKNKYITKDIVTNVISAKLRGTKAVGPFITELKYFKNDNPDGDPSNILSQFNHTSAFINKMELDLRIGQINEEWICTLLTQNRSDFNGLTTKGASVVSTPFDEKAAGSVSKTL